MGVQKSKCPSVKKYTRLYNNVVKIKNKKVALNTYKLNFKIITFKFIF